MGDWDWPRCLISDTMLSCLRQLSSRVPTLHDELALVTNTTSSTTTACALRDCHHFLSGNLDELPFTVVDLHLAPLKLQSKLNSELEAVRLSSLLEQADQSARTRLLSTSCREASAWIDALPSTQQLTLSSEVFSLSVLMRLGLALPVTRGMSTCQVLCLSGLRVSTCSPAVRGQDVFVFTMVWLGRGTA